MKKEQLGNHKTMLDNTHDDEELVLAYSSDEGFDENMFPEDYEEEFYGAKDNHDDSHDDVYQRIGDKWLEESFREETDAQVAYNNKYDYWY